MRTVVFKRTAVLIAVLGTLFAVFNLVRAEEEIEQTEAVSEDVIAEETAEESVAEPEEENVYETEVVEAFSEETECDAYESEETFVTEVPDETSEETLIMEEVEEEAPSYDVESCLIQGWYVPAFDYGEDGTVTYYLPDGTAFYTVDTDGLELPDYAWAYTGMRGYVDYLYGSVNGLDEEQTVSFESATDELLSGQGA